MSFRKKRSSPVKAEAVAVPRAKPLRDLPTPPPKAVVPDPRTTPARGWPIRPDTERTVRTPMLGEAVPLLGRDDDDEQEVLRPPEMSEAMLSDLAARLREPISDTNGNRQMLEMFQERRGGSLEDARQQIFGGESEQQRFTATQVADRQAGSLRSFEAVVQECHYEGGAGYSDGSPTRMARAPSPDDWRNGGGMAFVNRAAIELPGGMRFQLELPMGVDGEAHFGAYAKYRSERTYLPRAWAQAQERFRGAVCRTSFGLMLDGYVTFFFMLNIGGMDIGYATNSRNWHDWVEMDNQRRGGDPFADLLQRLLWHVFVDALPQFRRFRNRR